MRDFLRAAVFLWIVPFFAALSHALYAEEISFCASASFFSATNFFIFFTISVIAFLRRKLKTWRLLDTRNAFFADFVIAIEK